MNEVNNFEGEDVICPECLWVGKSGELVANTKKAVFVCPQCTNPNIKINKTGVYRSLNTPPF